MRGAREWRRKNDSKGERTDAAEQRVEESDNRQASLGPPDYRSAAGHCRMATGHVSRRRVRRHVRATARAAQDHQLAPGKCERGKPQLMSGPEPQWLRPALQS